MDKKKLEETELEQKHIFKLENAKKVTQCLEHNWYKYSNEEIACSACPTVNRINPLEIEKYVKSTN